MMLHTLNAMAGSDTFFDCLRSAAAGDAIVLIGDGVYSALTGSKARITLDNSPARILALDTDVRAAGIGQRIENLELVDMDGLVALTEYYPRQLAWY